jgi:cytosine/adenosine deaminase-related metal-dependent hydrolase
MTAPDEQVLTARWIFPATSAPLPRGTITIRGERIVSVDAHGERTADIDFGNAAIIPGLVNAHTHLDLSGMRGLTPPTTDFVGWLRGVIAHRQSQNVEQTATDIRAGLAECMRYGTTLIGDIASGGSSWNTLVESPLWAVCYREVLGLSAGRVHKVWSELCDWMNAHPDTPTCRAAVSPHAPYSVHRTLIEAASRIWPVCIHLAESKAEEELLAKRTGPFVSFLKDRGVWDPSGLSPSFDWVMWKTTRATSALIAHGNYLPNITPIPPNATIVYCPRTHAAFGHPPHPFRELLDRGVRIALGTDSLASNPDLDILAEARLIHEQYPDIPGEQLLRMATINGAEALGFGMTTGSLEAGKSADLVIVTLSNQDANEPHGLLLSQVDNYPKRRSMWRGEWRS